METDGKLKLVVVGLFLAAFVFGYFIISQRMQKVQTATPSPAPLNQQKNSNIEGVSSLPKTGFPLPLAGVFATSALVSGWFLRRFPN